MLVWNPIRVEAQHRFIAQLNDGTLKRGGVSGSGNYPATFKKFMTERQIRHLR